MMDGLGCAAVVIFALAIVGFWIWESTGSDQ